ncbi:MAG TPA: M23 family metallopeptidase [Caulobacteraceae bacterium]|nr:M23 family metallopeptidase [Caulobacteraceae bacterium]
MAAVLCLAGGWRLATVAAAAGARERPATAPSADVEVKPGESLDTALRRAGAPGDEADAATQALTAQLDPTALPADATVEASIAKPRFWFGPARLLGLTVHTGTAGDVVVARGYDGVFRLREAPPPDRIVTTVASGVMEGSLYQSAEKVGADLTLIAKLVKVFSRRLDFARDIRPGDHFSLVFERKVGPGGATVETGDLLYAEMDARGRKIRFYAFDTGAGRQFFDERGRSVKGLLLKTPVDGARIVSSPYGMREHPVLGYTRMHQGIDFAADTGTPVLAAGDGVVVETRPWGGYGNWLRIRHAGGWETGYAHLSAYARGLKVGDHVAQGQIVAYVGATGLATGPHLHYEVWKGGGRVNPNGAADHVGASLWGQELAAFRHERDRIDALRANAGSHGFADAGPTLPSEAAGLRS